MTEFAAVDPSERRKQVPRIERPREREKEKVKLEDIDKQLETLLEKDIV